MLRRLNQHRVHKRAKSPDSLALKSATGDGPKRPRFIIIICLLECNSGTELTGEDDVDRITIACDSSILFLLRSLYGYQSRSRGGMCKIRREIEFIHLTTAATALFNFILNNVESLKINICQVF